MSDAQRRTLTLLVAALLLVTGLLWLPAPSGDDEEDWSLAFPGLEEDAVVALELHRADELVRLERSDEGWVLTAPVRGSSDQTRAHGLLRVASSLELRPPLPEVAPTAYGLGPDEAIQVVLLGRDGERHAFRVGIEAAVGTATYVSVDGVLRPARGLLRGDFSVPVAQLRERRVWPPSMAELTAVTMRWQGDERVASANEGGWTTQGGAPVEHDDTLSSWLAELEDLRISRFEGGPAELLEAAGVLELVDSTGAHWTLTVGPPAGPGERWSRVPGESAIVAVSDLESLLERGLVLLSGRPTEPSPAGQVSSP